MLSFMCTGMRMVRHWSAMARVIAWRTHQVGLFLIGEPDSEARVVEIHDVHQGGRGAVVEIRRAPR